MSLRLWHGGARWIGDPQVQAPRPGRYECGPGIYLSTEYSDAYSYAKGGKVTTLVTLNPDLQLLEKTRLPLADVLAFVQNLPRLRKREAILADLKANVARRRDQGDPPMVDAAVLVNLCVNYEALSGTTGIALANWLVDQGIDASWHTAYGGRDWLVVFNPKVIKAYEVVRAADVPLDMRNLPRN